MTSASALVTASTPPGAESGRGLVIVDALADSWGVIAGDRRHTCAGEGEGATGRGKTVWFEMGATKGTPSAA